MNEEHLESEQNQEQITQADIEEAYISINRAWLTHLLNLQKLHSTFTGLEDLTYFKTTIVGPNNERYLLSLLHVDGPKFQLKEKENE